MLYFLNAKAPQLYRLAHALNRRINHLLIRTGTVVCGATLCCKPATYRRQKIRHAHIRTSDFMVPAQGLDGVESRGRVSVQAHARPCRWHIEKLVVVQVLRSFSNERDPSPNTSVVGVAAQTWLLSLQQCPVSSPSHNTHTHTHTQTYITMRQN